MGNCSDISFATQASSEISFRQSWRTPPPVCIQLLSSKASHIASAPMPIRVFGVFCKRIHIEHLRCLHCAIHSDTRVSNETGFL